MYQLDKGIFLEDKKILLPWGQALDKLSSENNAEVLKQVDRLVINWGTHKILNGLELDLTTGDLGTPNFLLSKKFTIISSWAIGDKEAKEFFNKVAEHLILNFGTPEKETDFKNDREQLWTWYTDDADIVLNLFEQHCFKCCLTIDQNL